MAEEVSRVGPAYGGLKFAGISLPLPQAHALAVPVVIIALLAMMIVPLPPLILDLLFSFNIAFGIVVLMVSAYAVKPLDFAVFPSILLVTTLMRLSLNVASTRAVLMEGHAGPGAAGSVIESFAQFVVSGSLAVGVVVFAILTVINFVVVTKGAGRIAEVSARFALDAMPGKQMAIDADLNAGAIDQKEARERRQTVAQEADFFGAMDGASKFVRGDAIAGILILVINIVGGMLLGTIQHGLSVGEAANAYLLLAIGDALAAQVPSLIISVAAALVVSRVGQEDDLGGQVFKQMFSIPRALGVAAAVVAILGSVPGMPHIPFLILAAVCGYLAWSQATAAQKAKEQATAEPVATDNQEANWDDVTPVDILGLELGYKLISLVDEQNGAELLSRIKGVRKKFAQEVGFLPPAVHIRDNLELKPARYRITLKGVVVGETECFPQMWLAINPGRATVALPGPQTTDPAFGLPAQWIEAAQRDAAQAAGYTVVDAATVVATHLHHLMQVNASSLLGQSEVQKLLDHISQYSPKLVEDLVPKIIPIPRLQRVLQNLLSESVHVRDARTILETLAEHGSLTEDPRELSEAVRRALSPALIQQIFGNDVTDLNVIAIDPELESLLMQAMADTPEPALEPSVAQFFSESVSAAAQSQEDEGYPACLLVPDKIRHHLTRMVRKAAPRLSVLSHSEIPENQSIRISRMIGEKQ